MLHSLFNKINLLCFIGMSSNDARRQLLGDSTSLSDENFEDDEYDVRKRLTRQDGMLDNIIRIQIDTEEIGKNTLETLDNQGKKLTDIKEKVTDINQNLSKSQRLLRFIKLNEYKIKAGIIIINAILIGLIILVIYLKAKSH